MEYLEAGGPVPDEQPSETPETESAPPQPEPAFEPLPDPAEILAARIEEERISITAQVRQEAEREIQRARTEISHAVEQFGQQRGEYFRQAEAEVVNLALAIARRLIHRETQIDPRLLAGLVKFELDQLESATNVRLFVAPDTLGYWNEAAPTMSRPVEIVADKALTPGDARIETVLGATTVSFERELKEIERGFFDLLSHRPPPTETRTVLVQ
jgi:flagellar assembly protein FliH